MRWEDCPSCRRVVPKGRTAFCPYCGAAIDPATALPVPSSRITDSGVSHYAQAEYKRAIEEHRARLGEAVGQWRSHAAAGTIIRMAVGLGLSLTGLLLLGVHSASAAAINQPDNQVSTGNISVDFLITIGGGLLFFWNPGDLTTSLVLGAVRLFAVFYLVLAILMIKIMAMLFLFTLRITLASFTGEGPGEAFISLASDYFNLWIWALELALPR